MNPVPTITSLAIVALRLPEFGVTLVTVGGGFTRAFTVNAAAALPVCASGFVTVTVRAPSVAANAMVMFAERCVEFVNVQEVTVMPAPKLQVPPDWNPVPVMTVTSVAACAPEFGLVLVTVGAGGTGRSTVNTLALLPLCASGLVTVTVRTPVAAAAAMEMFAGRLLAEPNTQALTVIPTPNVPVAPDTTG